MGFFKDMRTIVGLNEAAKKDPNVARYLRNVEEWDCFEPLVQEWKEFFLSYCKKNKVSPKDLRHGGKIFDDAMRLSGSTPPAKRSGGNATARAKHLCDKYGKGEGPSFGAAMSEGLHLAKGGRSNYR